jgi:bifunctional ADP-heptose synthase (sugar kinase/adenylyltransferase)
MILFGEDGVQVIRFPVFGNPDCRDVTGAGDTVAAANAVAQAVGASLLEAALLANIAGSIVVQKVGTATANIGELRAALRSEYECWTRTWLSQE